MKTNHNESWHRLVALARQAPTQTPSGPPLGFATRTAARGLTPIRRSLAGIFEPFALRALSLASVVAVAVFMLNLSPVLQAVNEEIAVSEVEPYPTLVET